MAIVTQTAIDQNFSAIRRTIESGNYDGLDALLVEQRALIGSLPLADPEARACIAQAQDLTAWSLNMVQMQRSALAHAISDLNRKKLLQESYADVL